MAVWARCGCWCVLEILAPVKPPLTRSRDAYRMNCSPSAPEKSGTEKVWLLTLQLARPRAMRSVPSTRSLSSALLANVTKSCFTEVALPPHEPARQVCTWSKSVQCASCAAEWLTETQLAVAATLWVVEQAILKLIDVADDVHGERI